jgi:hypothetical protein
MKSIILWDITPCRPLKVNRLASSFHAGILRGLLDPENGSDYVPPESRLTFNGLHGLISHKVVFFNNNIGNYAMKDSDVS